MPFRVFQLVQTFLLDLVQVLTRSTQDQALAVVLLRHQLRIALRQAPSAPLSWLLSSSVVGSWDSLCMSAKKAGRMSQAARTVTGEDRRSRRHRPAGPRRR